MLQKFKVDAPDLLQNVKLQVKDMDIHKIDGVEPNVSIKDTWAKMKENNVKTIPILKDEELVGVISTGDIATSYMDVYDNRVLSDAKTQYKNIIRTLDGTLVTGNEHGYFTKGKVAIGASNPDLMAEFIEKDDLVILGNRYESQACAVDMMPAAWWSAREPRYRKNWCRRQKKEVSSLSARLMIHLRQPG